MDFSRLACQLIPNLLQSRYFVSNSWYRLLRTDFHGRRASNSFWKPRTIDFSAGLANSSILTSNKIQLCKTKNETNIFSLWDVSCSFSMAIGSNVESEVPNDIYFFQSLRKKYFYVMKIILGLLNL